MATEEKMMGGMLAGMVIGFNGVKEGCCNAVV